MLHQVVEMVELTQAAAVEVLDSLDTKAILEKVETAAQE
jgi:hypothetical protein